MKLLRAENISRRLDKKFELQNISFEIRPDEIICILGESGSGKTTLLRILAGFETVDSGKLFFGDICLASPTIILPAEKRNFGLVFQEYALFPHMNVAKNILYGYKGKKEESLKVLNELLSKVGLLGFENKYPHELSGGQQQRVALARTLASEPNLILLDEPFSNLDHSLRAEMRDQLKKILQKTGKPSIIVTHDIDDSMSLADRMIILKDGKILQSGSPKEIFNNPVNEYTAKLFGKINLFNSKQLKNIFAIDYPTDAFVRPFQIEITQDENGNAKILEQRFMGTHYELLVSCDELFLTVNCKSELDLIKLATVKLKVENLIPLNYAK